MLRSDSVSGYASLGSLESFENKIGDETPNIVHDTIVRRDRPFRSQFARHLDEKIMNLTLRPKNTHRVGKSLSDVRGGTQLKQADLSELKRLKLENEQLRLKIQICIDEDEKYQSLCNELERLTQKISQVSTRSNV